MALSERHAKAKARSAILSWAFGFHFSMPDGNCGKRGSAARLNPRNMERSATNERI
jgi:hypothetical protein